MVGSVDEPCLACSCENFPVTIDIRPALLQTGEHTGGSHGDFERTPATAFGGRGIATAERATAFLRTVYGWMCAGLAITALLFLGLFVGQIALVLFLSARLDRLAPGIGVPAGVRAWEVYVRGRGPREGCPPPEGVDVAYPLRRATNTGEIRHFTTLRARARRRKGVNQSGRYLSAFA